MSQKNPNLKLKSLDTDTLDKKTEYENGKLACVWKNDKCDLVLILRNHLNQVMVLIGDILNDSVLYGVVL